MVAKETQAIIKPLELKNSDLLSSSPMPARRKKNWENN